jgi:hypothetical protein
MGTTVRPSSEEEGHYSGKIFINSTNPSCAIEDLFKIYCTVPRYITVPYSTVKLKEKATGKSFFYVLTVIFVIFTLPQIPNKEKHISVDKLQLYTAAFDLEI